MCKDDQYGCHATATAGVVWTGIETDIGLPVPTEAPITRTPSTAEGCEAWGIKFLSVCLSMDRVGTKSAQISNRSSSLRCLKQLLERLSQPRASPRYHLCPPVHPKLRLEVQHRNCHQLKAHLMAYQEALKRESPSARLLEWPCWQQQVLYSIARSANT